MSPGLRGAALRRKGLVPRVDGSVLARRCALLSLEGAPLSFEREFLKVEALVGTVEGVFFNGKGDA